MKRTKRINSPNKNPTILILMGTRRGYTSFFPPGDTGVTLKPSKAVPHEFVLDAIAHLSPRTRSMFGCLAIYVGDKIVLILREKLELTSDNGIWLATTQEHHESLRREFPRMRSVQLFGKKETDWQVLSSSSPDFEEAALRACELIVAGDPRIGKVPAARRKSPSKAKKAAKSAKSIKLSKSPTKRLARS